ncbi:MAG: GGDEF domain-containing protein [Lachnospiraceae bacterium]|nr:GGDEF domain-containing protein [Lachnospiraceae bacterium]
MRKIYTTLFVLAILILVIYIFVESGRISSTNEEKLRPFSDGWSAGAGEPLMLNEARPGKFGGTVKIEKRLPDDIEDNDCFCFESRNGYIYIYVDNRKVYTYEPVANFTGIGYGTYFHEVPLNPEDSGHLIKIELKGMYKRYGRVISAYIGPAGDYIHMSIVKRTLPAFVSGLIVFLGFVMIVIYISIPDKESMPFNILALGAAGMILGTWLLLDTSIMQLMTGKVYLWRGLNRLSILFSAYPCVVFINSLTRLKRPVYTHIGFWYNFVVVAVTITARFAFGYDMIKSLAIAAGFLVAGILVLMTVAFWDNAVFCKKQGFDIGIRKYYPGMAAFVICAVLDVVLYGCGIMVGDSYGSFSRIGFAIFMILSMLQFLGWWTRDRADIERERFINRTLQYAMSSDSPQEGIESMLDYMGRTLKARRVCIFEEQGNGKYHGTYEWFEEGQVSADTGLIYLPYEGFIDDLYKSFKANGDKFIVDSPETYKTANPAFYNFSQQYSISNLVAGPLEKGGSLTGFLAFIDTPDTFLEETSNIINIVSYFVNQLITQREEKKRLRYYSYNDAMTGAQNRRAFNDYLRDGFDPASAFGFLICHANGVDEANRSEGYEAGDRLILKTFRALSDVFSKENIYKLGGAEFAVFGYESDEILFNTDVDRARSLMDELKISVSIGAVYCAFGTMDIKKVIKHVNKLLRDGM